MVADENEGLCQRSSTNLKLCVFYSIYMMTISVDNRSVMAAGYDKIS